MALVSAQTPSRYKGALYPLLKQPAHEGDHISSCGGEVKDE